MLRRRVAGLWLTAFVSCQVYEPSQLVPNAGGAMSTSNGVGGQSITAGAKPATDPGLGGTAGEAGGGAGGSPPTMQIINQAGEGGAIDTGLAGAAGAPSVGPIELIDDMEDADPFILRNAGRIGAWYSFADPSSAATFAIETGVNRIDSRYGLHLTSNGFSEYGGVGFAVNSNGTPSPYDASQYEGIQLWLRVEDDSVDSLHLAISDRSTHPAAMECDVAMASGPEACFDDWLAAVVGLTTVWQRFEVSFADLRQQGWGKQGGATIDLSSVFEVQLQLATGGEVALWVDDVALIPR